MTRDRTEEVQSMLKTTVACLAKSPKEIAVELEKVREEAASAVDADREHGL